jgi:hypothetical protein
MPRFGVGRVTYGAQDAARRAPPTGEEQMNESGRWGWLAAFGGVAFFVIGIVSFIIMGEPKAADEPVEEIVDFYLDNKDSVIIGAVMGVLAGLALIVFGAHLREVLRAGGARSDVLPTLAFVGTVITAIGFAIDGTIVFALAEAADDIEPSGVQTLQALWDNDFLPIMLGAEAFLWGTGLSALITGVLPKWLGGIMVVAAILGFTPIGWIGVIVAALSILGLSVVLTMRARRGPAPA